MICTKCDNKVDDYRYHLGYTECTDCSDTEKYSAHVVYPHKTGAYVQPVSETASKMKLDTTLKSASYKVGGDKAGYSFWQTLKFATKTYLDAEGNIVAEAAKQIEKNEQMLSESMINEIEFKNTLKKIYTTANEKLVSIFKLLLDKIKRIVEVAKEIIKGGIDKILNYFELDVDVKVNPRVNFKV